MSSALPIRKFLDASLYHLPKSLYEQALHNKGPLSAWISDYGCFAYVTEEEILKQEELPDSVIQLFGLARRFNCDYILFDCDAALIEGIAIFDWEDGSTDRYAAIRGDVDEGLRTIL